MPIELSKEEILKSMGKLAGAGVEGAVSTATTPTGGIKLQLMSKGIDILAKHLDRVLERFNPPVAPPKAPPSAAVEKRAQKMVEREGKKTPTSKPPEKKINLTGADITEAFQTFIGVQDDKITLGEFKIWLEQNKAKMAGVLDTFIKRL